MEKYLDLKNDKDYTKIKEASKIINNGGLVLFPTETVYGIGADGLNEQAVKNIFKILRKVDSYNPDIVLIEGVQKDGLGLAIMNRLIRACEHNYIEL